MYTQFVDCSKYESQEIPFFFVKFQMTNDKKRVFKTSNLKIYIFPPFTTSINIYL